MASFSSTPQTGVPAHVVASPRWTLGLRLAQAIFAFLILALSAYSASKVHVPEMQAAYGLNIFSCIATFIVVGYVIASTVAVHAIYNMWAVLGLDIFLTIMWLVSFAVMASMSNNFVLIFYTNYYYYKRDVVKRSASGYIPWETGAAAAGLGALEFILFLVTLIFFALTLHKHRMATRGTTAAPLAGAPAPAAAGTTAAVPMTQETKYETAPAQEAGAVPFHQQPMHQQPLYQQPMHQQAAPMQTTPTREQTQYSTAPEVHAPAYTAPA